MHVHRSIVLAFVAVASVALLSAGSANAASETYYLSLNNDTEGWIPSGTVDYATVTIADNLNLTDIDITVEILDPLLNIADANFGISNFMFNSTNELLVGDIIGLPVNWNASVDYDPAGPHQVGEGFGRFEIETKIGPMGMRQSPTLSFTISKDGDTIADYAVLATNGQQDSFFALHVAGFVDQDLDDPLDPPDGTGLCTVDGEGNFSAGCNILTSAWFGGTSTTPVPEPSTALLVGLGLVGLAVQRRR
jgi:hypothetical protein